MAAIPVSGPPGYAMDAGIAGANRAPGEITGTTHRRLRQSTRGHTYLVNTGTVGAFRTPEFQLQHPVYLPGTPYLYTMQSAWSMTNMVVPSEVMPMGDWFSGYSVTSRFGRRAPSSRL